MIRKNALPLQPQLRGEKQQNFLRNSNSGCIFFSSLKKKINNPARNSKKVRGVVLGFLSQKKNNKITYHQFCGKFGV